MAIEIQELALGAKVSWIDSTGQEHLGVIDGYRVAGKVEGYFPGKSDELDNTRDMVYVSFDGSSTTKAAALFLDGTITVRV